MKKLNYILILFTVFVLSSASLFAGDQNIDGKIGTAYGKSPDKFGLNIEADYFYELDPYFAVGLETGLFWMQWTQKLTSDEAATNLGTYPEKKYNAYMFPFLAMAQVRLPNFKETIGITPYFGGGLGFSLMTYSYNDGEKDQLDVFNGFSWVVNAGVAYSPSASSNIEFLLDLAYRGADLTHQNRTANMSGFKAMLGVRYRIGGGSDGSSSYY